MPDIKIKRYADKENLKELMKYSKDTFATQSVINENYYTKEQVDILLESVSGGTGGGTGGDYYTKSEIDTKLNSYVTLNGVQTISGAKTFTGNIIGINKNNSTEDANNLYPSAAGSKRTYYTIANSYTKLANVPDGVCTILESRTIRRLTDSDWVVEQICHNSNGLYYRRGSNEGWGAWKTFAFTDDVDLSNYYNKSEVDNLLRNIGGGTSDLSNYYTKPEVDNLLSYTSINSITIEEIERICVL